MRFKVLEEKIISDLPSSNESISESIRYFRELNCQRRDKNLQELSCSSSIKNIDHKTIADALKYRSLDLLQLIYENLGKFLTVGLVKRSLDSILHINIEKQEEYEKISNIIKQDKANVVIDVFFCEIDFSQNANTNNAMKKLSILLTYQNFEDVKYFCDIFYSLINSTGGVKHDKKQLGDIGRLIELIIETRAYTNKALLDVLVMSDKITEWINELNKVSLIQKMVKSECLSGQITHAKEIALYLMRVIEEKRSSLVNKIKALRNCESKKLIEKIQLIAEDIEKITLSDIDGYGENIDSWYSRSTKAENTQDLTVQQLVEEMNKQVAEGLMNYYIRDQISTNGNSESAIEKLLMAVKDEARRVQAIDGLKTEIVKEWDDDDIKKWAQNFKKKKLSNNDLKWGDGKDNAVLEEVLSVLCQAVKVKKLFAGFPPRDTQLMAVALFLNKNTKGRFGNVSTGEGKSIITVMLAICLGLINKKVDIVTSSKILAIRDSLNRDHKTKEGFREFFELFDLKVSNNCDEECDSASGEKVRKKRYSECDIIYGEASYFQKDLLLSKYLGKKIREGDCIGNALILDEVDNMVIDNALKVLYISHNMSDMRHLKDVFIHIWAAVNSPEDRDYSKYSVRKISKYIRQRIGDYTEIEINHSDLRNRLNGLNIIDKKIDIENFCLGEKAKKLDENGFLEKEQDVVRMIDMVSFNRDAIRECTKLAINCINSLSENKEETTKEILLGAEFTISKECLLRIAQSYPKDIIEDATYSNIRDSIINLYQSDQLDNLQINQVMHYVYNYDIKVEESCIRLQLIDNKAIERDVLLHVLESESLGFSKSQAIEIINNLEDYGQIYIDTKSIIKKLEKEEVKELCHNNDDLLREFFSGKVGIKLGKDQTIRVGSSRVYAREDVIDAIKIIIGENTDLDLTVGINSLITKLDLKEKYWIDKDYIQTKLMEEKYQSEEYSELRNLFLGSETNIKNGESSKDYIEGEIKSVCPSMQDKQKLQSFVKDMGLTSSQLQLAKQFQRESTEENDSLNLASIKLENGKSYDTEDIRDALSSILYGERDNDLTMEETDKLDKIISCLGFENGKKVSGLMEEVRLPVPSTLKTFVYKNLRTWIGNAYNAKDMYEDDQFIIGDKKSQKKGEIIIMDKDTGVEQNSSKWSSGLHVFLQLKHNKKVTNETFKAVFVSNMKYFSSYNALYGMTGTIGGKREREILKECYQVDFFEMPRFKKYLYRYDRESESVCGTEEQWIANIIGDIDNKMNSESIYDKHQLQIGKEDLEDKIKKLEIGIETYDKIKTIKETEEQGIQDKVTTYDKLNNIYSELLKLKNSNNLEYVRQSLETLDHSIEGLNGFKDQFVILQSKITNSYQELDDKRVQQDILDINICKALENFKQEISTIYSVDNSIVSLKNKESEKLEKIQIEIRDLNSKIESLVSSLESYKNDLQYYNPEPASEGQLNKKRAVLLICENISSLKKIKSEVNAYYSNQVKEGKIKIYHYDRAYEKLDLEVVQPGDIIIATNIAGRGTDLYVSKAVEINGGLHVILTYMPSNERVEQQAFGRTARAGNNGTGTYIVYDSKILYDKNCCIDQLRLERSNKDEERLQAPHTTLC